MQPRPTIKDVAARAGVSRQTVSRVLNDKPEVSPETRDRVLRTIDELGYRPSAVARSMVAGRTRTLGCISPNLTDYSLACIIEGAQAAARQKGYFVLTGSAPHAADAEPLLEEMLHRQVDGLLILNPRADERYVYLLPLVEQGLSVVYLGSTPKNEAVCSVRCDDQHGAYQVGRHIIAQGHTRIAMITGPQNEDCVQDRIAGYVQAFTEAGLPVSADLIATGDWSPDSGYQAMQQLLAGPPFTALFAQNDRMAVGAIRAAREQGRHVPEDLAVVGFDDIPLASYFDPPLTTIHQDFLEHGRRAADLLIDCLLNPESTIAHVTVPCQLVVRRSCGSLN
ncbi:MAG: LacI family transcriptional regulator [Chloroflexi bacterium]|nr:LacI family transcriptional regulator [Chloroflexota bacterium]MBU1748653.1 LacI family transcriptional regulator [Chloroflexota bacterium]